MRNFVSFRYGSFYDVPRSVVLSYRERYFFLDSPFDENADEYPDHYSVYLFPASIRIAAESSSWDFARDLKSLIYLGSVKISDCDFDKSKRKQLDAAVLDPFLIV